MKNALFLFTGMLVCVSLNAQYNSRNLTPGLHESGMQEHTFEKLGIYPIYANEAFRAAHKNVGFYKSLEEALNQKKIIITEVSNSGTVNSIFAENVSADSIFLLSGEILTGGKQDRVLAQDVIIAPGEKVDLSVFCVEKGRWAQGGDGNAFRGYYSVATREVRKAAELDKNQNAVWDQVDKTTRANRGESSTKTYAHLQQSEEYQKNFSLYFKHFESAYHNDDRVIGVVVVSGDKVIGCDLFATHQLFAQTYNNLLHSYITEALTNGSKVNISPQKIKEYLENFLADENEQEKRLKDNGTIFKHNENQIRISIY